MGGNCLISLKTACKWLGENWPRYKKYIIFKNHKGCFNIFLLFVVWLGTDVSSCNAHGRSPLHLAQSKLRMLTQCKSDVCTSVKQTVLKVIEMLLVYFDKKNSSDEAELLNAFQTRLQISDTGERVSTEIQDLLNNLSTLKLNK